MSDLVYPSDVALKAIGLTHPNTDILAEHDGRCGYCGKPHKSGDEVDFNTVSKSFTIEKALFDPHAMYRCLSCAGILDEKEFIFRWGNAVATTDGLYPCLKRVDRAYWILNPPEPPYTFYLQVSKSQHVAWRAPVNYSKEVQFIRLGEDVLRIRTAKVHEGVAATNALKTLHQQFYATKRIKHKPMRTALTFCDMKYQRLRQSEFLHWVNLVVELEPSANKHVDTLMQLTAHECYALDFVMNDNEISRPARFERT